MIKSLYSYAMERDIVGKDYSKYLDIPSVGAKRPRDALNDLQLAKLAQLAADGFPWADTALMLCYTGFRVSEFLQLTQFSYHPDDGGYLQGGLKTEAQIREDGGRMKPLVIVKVNGHHDKEKEDSIISDIRAGFDRGQLILSGDCAVIAFDEEGRMVYPIRKEAAQHG